MFIEASSAQDCVCLITDSVTVSNLIYFIISSSASLLQSSVESKQLYSINMQILSHDPPEIIIIC